MGVNLWGGSPLYVNPVNMLNTLAKVLAEGKGVSVRKGLKEAGVQSYEPTNRNSIQGHLSGEEKCYGISIYSIFIIFFIGIALPFASKHVFDPCETGSPLIHLYT
jgi:hypothetical protein